ncbi:MAG: NusA-like transcription termination signal-binding factor [Candidatus Aenigmarchaeota archaeon]|nr:NusA-like transcription termination signal-binding factor [Candidatus Aenigmarchaeota archaeon]
MPVTFDTDTIQLINLFENVTKAHVKDCFVNDDNIVYFIVKGSVGKAVGKNGASIKSTERMIRKGVRVVQFSENLETYAKNLIPQATKIATRNENGKIFLDVWIDRNTKPIIIGRDGKNLKVLKELLQRSHDVFDVIIR